MSKKELLDVLNKTSEIEKLLTPMGGSFMPGLKTINRNVEFQTWKEELKIQLQKLKKEQIINETLELLNNGFKNGMKDEKDFNQLQGKLKTISSHIDDFIDNEKEELQMPESLKLKKGTRIKTAFDEYTLEKQIGEGGNGRVFSAKNKSDESVAIKFVEQHIDTKKLKRFKNEIHFCEHHTHKNIVKIYDRGYAFLDNKDYVFYVMPLYKETLKNKIKAGIPHEKILDIFIGLVDGLKYAHEHESIHRDIKPENIMFAEGSWEPIICDFGIAHFAEEDLLTVVETKATDRMANFQYAAPEQRQKGGIVSYQTDIYALALILNEMFTGEIPQAAGHKRIADVNSEYKYLDDLFDMLFKQSPDERLYPETLILSELVALSEHYKRDNEKAKLKTVVNDVIEPEDFKPAIVNMDFKNNNLYFYFDSTLPEDWIQFLINGSYSHSAQIGYDNYNLKKHNNTTIYMPFHGSEREDTIKRVVGYVTQWVDTVNREYSQSVKRKAIEEQRKKEAARLAEIKRLEHEDQMNTTINSLLKELL